VSEIVPNSSAPLTNHEAPLVQIGDILVSEHWIVTPNGPAPLAGSQWTVRDMSTVTRHTPSWAVVLAVFGFFFFFLGLLFLLVKEDRVAGYVEVSVRSGNLFHLTQIPRATVAGAQALEQVRYAQQLAAHAARKA
jgi:hypothetical protein